MKINYLKTYLPTAIRQGSCAERLNKAEELTRTFNLKLQHALQYGDVSEKGLKTMLKNTIKHPIPIDIIPDTTTGRALVTHASNEAGLVEGYTMFLPFNSATNSLPKKNATILLRQIMVLFQEMLNPKYFQRVNLLFNRGLATVAECTQFYNNKIYTKSPLELKTLNVFLSGKTSDEKIDILQVFRHNIIKEINVQKFLKKDKEEYHLKLKLEMINERLLKEIKTVRNRTKNSLSKKKNIKK